MTRKKDTALAQPVTPDKWERQRNAERITLQDRKTARPCRTSIARWAGGMMARN